MPLRFLWDPAKDASNARKHAVTFREASTVFDDPLSATVEDPDHSLAERRFITIGLSDNNRLLVVAHAEDGNDLRIISARPANRRERRVYEEAE